jgi:hypothetical protein
MPVVPDGVASTLAAEPEDCDCLPGGLLPRL